MTTTQKFNAVLVILIIVSVVLSLYLFIWIGKDHTEKYDPLKATDILPGMVTASAPLGKDIEEQGAFFDGDIIADKTSFLLEANEKDVEYALEGGGTVIFYFYAKWCASCKKEMRDALVPAFKEDSVKETIGFLVNWGDSDVEPFEKKLGEDYGVVSQHTKVVVRGGRVLGVFPLPWGKEEYLKVINQ